MGCVLLLYVQFEDVEYNYALSSLKVGADID
jgi:hypothetical protein